MDGKGDEIDAGEEPVAGENEGEAIEDKAKAETEQPQKSSFWNAFKRGKGSKGMGNVISICPYDF